MLVTVIFVMIVKKINSYDFKKNVEKYKENLKKF